MKTYNELGFTIIAPKPNAEEFLMRHKSREDSSSADDQCGTMITYQLVVFVVFYVSLFVIIIFMYCKHRKE